MILENLKQCVFLIMKFIINMSMANDEQDQLLKNINEFKSKTVPKHS